MRGQTNSEEGGNDREKCVGGRQEEGQDILEGEENEEFRVYSGKGGNKIVKLGGHGDGLVQKVCCG